MTFKRGNRSSPEAIAKMKEAWTPERRAKQAERAKGLYRRSPSASIKTKATKALWSKIRRRQKKWRSITRRTTTIPFLYGIGEKNVGVDVQVLIAYTTNGCIQIQTRWRTVKVINGSRAPRWTPEAKRAQAARLALPGRRFPGQPREVLMRGTLESVRRRKLKKLWTPERRLAQSIESRKRIGVRTHSSSPSPSPQSA